MFLVEMRNKLMELTIEGKFCIVALIPKLLKFDLYPTFLLGQVFDYYY